MTGLLSACTPLQSWAGVTAAARIGMPSVRYTDLLACNTHGAYAAALHSTIVNISSIPKHVKLPQTCFLLARVERGFLLFTALFVHTDDWSG